MGATGYVGKRLIDRDPLDEWCEIVQHCNRGIAQSLVFLEVTADKNQLRAKVAGTPSRHAAMYAEGLGFVRRREHDTAADRDRLSAQRRVKQLLDRGVERIQVGVKDGRRRFHPIPTLEE